MGFDEFQETCRSNGDNEYVTDDMDAFQAKALEMAFFPVGKLSAGYLALALCGESGELAEHVKKTYRDHSGEFSPERVDLIVKELGDILWYVSVMADHFHVPLSAVAAANVEKLKSRKARGTSRGDGDNR